MTKYTAEQFARHFPILASLIRTGTVYVEGTQYVGRSTVPSIMAPEGLVGIGSVGDEIATERYLQRFPNPAQW